MSPHRHFLDDDGLLWQAWDVMPSWGERRTHERRESPDGPPDGSSERRRKERRTHRGIRIGLLERLIHGWLAFESNGMRRRIAPIPEGWHVLSEEDLRELWRSSTKLPDRRGRLAGERQ